MLNVRTYLPSLEHFGSLPDTLLNDVTIDGENSYVVGIPEELIAPAENQSESNEGDNVIEDNNAEMNEAKEEKEEIESDQSTTETKENQGDSLNETQTEHEPAVKDEDFVEGGDTDNDKLKEEEDEISEVQYAIECYKGLLATAGVDFTRQSAAFLQPGLQRINRKLGITEVSLEDFSFDHHTGRMTVSAEALSETIKNADRVLRERRKKLTPPL